MKSKSPEPIKSLVSDILRHLFERTSQSGLDLTSATNSFLRKNVNNTSEGPVTLVKTFKYLPELGAVKIVTASLEFLKTTLNGRANYEFTLMSDEVLEGFQ